MKLPSLTGAQQQAVDRLEHNLALQSGAGCGKTRVLAERFSSLLLAGPDRPNLLSRLVAVTFTDKAALEMTQRVRAMLRAFAEQARSQTDRRKLLDWLQRANEARISTIHGFCASLLRGWAVEAGLDPDFAVAEASIVTSRLLNESVEQALLDAVQQAQPEVLTLLEGDWMTVDRLLPIVAHLVSERGRIDLNAYDEPAETLSRWSATLGQQQARAQRALRDDPAVRAALGALAGFACDDPDDKLLPVFEHARGLAETILAQPIEDSAEPFEELLAVQPGCVGGKKHWIGGTPKDVRDAIKALQGVLKPYAEYAGRIGSADERAAAELAGLTALARQADRRYAQAKRQAGLIDFDDLLIHTRDLLDRNPALRDAVGRGIDQILIDEAQDTDAVQLHLLLNLLTPDLDALPADGRLFLVGDAKQSIYRFRGAQLEVFTDLCERLGRDRQLDLAESFRTHPAGVAFVNRVFGQLMGDGYTPIASKRLVVADHPTVEVLLAHGSEDLPVDSAGDDPLAQAALIAQRIEEMIRNAELLVHDCRTDSWRAVRPGDVAILFTRMTHSLEFERQLQLRNLPYYVLGGTGFFRQQEVFDILNALRAIDNPFDDVAVIGVLRSALVGLNDNALTHLAKTHGRPYLPGLDLDRLADRFDDFALGALRRAKRWLGELHVRKDALGIDALIGRVLDATGFEAALLARPGGIRRVGNVRMLRDRARQADGQMTLAEFLRLIDVEVLSDERTEQAAVSGEEDDVIRLMTVHKAKGLEFPVVFVPDLNIGQQSVTDRLLHRMDWGLVANFTPSNDTQKSTSYRLARQREKEDQHRETLRKYYVALTRHEDHLVLVGANRRNQAGLFLSGGSFLDELDGVLGIGDAIDREKTSLEYGEGFSVRLEVRAPEPARPDKTHSSPGRKLLDAANGPADLASKLFPSGSACGTAALGCGRSKPGATELPPPLLAPLPEESTDLELATTALTDFEHCPALYRWRYELRGPNRPGTPNGPGDRGATLNPLQLGSLLHRCWELLDFARPQPAGELLDRALHDLDLPCDGDARTAALAELTRGLERFTASDLAGSLASAARTLREQSFLLDAGALRLRGQIDLLAEIDGAWHVVDYKSDRVVNDADLAAKADRYRLQVLTYAQAVQRLTGHPPASATLYFLRTGQSHPVDVSPEALESARRRFAELADRLRQARRKNRWDRCGLAICDFCHLAGPDPLR